MSDKLHKAISKLQAARDELNSAVPVPPSKNSAVIRQMLFDLDRMIDRLQKVGA